eukprot:4969387-Pyramimonas_sp.AAC.1
MFRIRVFVATSQNCGGPKGALRIRYDRVMCTQADLLGVHEVAEELDGTVAHVHAGVLRHDLRAQEVVLPPERLQLRVFSHPNAH